MSERFIPIHITTERTEVERTCAALEALSIPILVEHIAVSHPGGGEAPCRGYRILTALSSEQHARAIIGRSLMSGAAA